MTSSTSTTSTSAAVGGLAEPPAFDTWTAILASLPGRLIVDGRELAVDAGYIWIDW